MKRFKLHTGKYRSYDINRDNFEELTKGMSPYCQTGNDGKKRCFGVCPACDNPITLVGLYVKDDSFVPYGRHYNTDVAGIASHNEQAYYLCPYASINRIAPSKNDLKENMTSFEEEIYNIVRNYYDKVIYILQQDTGILISNTFAEDLLRDYVASRGWMYRWATIYNIPWMVMYLYHGFNLYGKIISLDSFVGEWAINEKNVIVRNMSANNYGKIDTASFARYIYMFYKHRRKIVDDDLVETISVEISRETGTREWETLKTSKIEISENRFLNLITSQKALSIRDYDLLDVAKRIMPKL